MEYLQRPRSGKGAMGGAGFLSKEGQWNVVDNRSRGEILEREGFKCGLRWDGGG